MRYIALVDGMPGAIGVVFPDCPGCTAMGKTEDEALHNAIAALAEWIQDEEREGRAKPRARWYTELSADPEVREALGEGALLISVPYLPEAAGKWVRVNLSLESELLKAIDDAAEERGLTRSSFLAGAAREKIAAGV